VAWTFAGNASERATLPYRFTTTPVVGSDGTVYTTALQGSTPNYTVVFALDGSGAEKWRFVTRSPSDVVTNTDVGDFAFITSATYGTSTSKSDVTGALRSRTQLRTVVHLAASTNFNLLFGDPLIGTVKDLHVTYLDSVKVMSGFDHRFSNDSPFVTTFYGARPSLLDAQRGPRGVVYCFGALAVVAVNLWVLAHASVSLPAAMLVSMAVCFACAPH
jgi:hypothetical protein